MFDLAEMLRVPQVILGIGLVIFVHEMGHFLAARWCGVKVDLFSLGFGPRLFGWTRGDTTYQVAAIPLGGFVRMKGDDAYREGRGDLDSDDLQSKSVGARFFIYSAGVIMNVILGVVLFPILFTVGVPFTPPIVGDVTPGGPAWRAGLRTGDEIVAIGGRELFSFDQILNEVAVSDAGTVDVRVRDAETGEERVVVVTPEHDEQFGFYVLGIRQPLDPDRALYVTRGSPASEVGLVTGDLLLEVEGGDPELEPYQRLMAWPSTAQGAPLRVQVSSEGETRWVDIEPKKRTGPTLIGIQPVANLVVGRRDVDGAPQLDLREGDRILRAGDRAVHRGIDVLDAIEASSGAIEFLVERGGVERVVASSAPWTEAQVEAFAESIALGLDEDSSRVLVQEGHPAFEAGLRDGDRISRVDGIEMDEWADIKETVQAAARDDRAMVVAVMRDAAAVDGPAAALEFDLRAREVPFWDYGLGTRPASYLYKSEGIAESVEAGLLSSWYFLESGWRTIKSMLIGRVGAENLGGIITISAVSYGISEEGLAKLLFFLCMLSINLAFINVLPIPVLDGGHLFFLIVEKLKGSPVSDRVMGYSQLVGLVVILTLMVFVTFNDINRWFFQ